MDDKRCLIDVPKQVLLCYLNNKHYKTYPVSTGKNGLGEQSGSQCTPRGKHRIHAIIGFDNLVNSVFVAREWTGEIYSAELSQTFPQRDWILTRILQLDGLEPGFNQGGDVDSLKRFIYIHGTPDSTLLGVPGSHGCIRMRNEDIVELANWVSVDTQVYVTNDKGL